MAIKESFCQSCRALLVAFLQLNQENSAALLDYMNKNVDAEKFAQQLQFCFTTQDRALIWEHGLWNKYRDNCGRVHETKNNKTIYLPTDKSRNQIWGEHIIWIGSDCVYNGYKLGEYQSKSGYINGDLGEESAPSPLVEGLMAIFNFTHFTLINFQ